MSSEHYLSIDNLGKVCLNGVFVDQEDQCLHVSNRAFRYGDGFFESIRLVNGKPIFLSEHFKRLTSAFNFFGFDLPESLVFNKLKEGIGQLAAQNGVLAGGKARLIVWRKPGGLYGATGRGVEFLLECESIEPNGFQLNPKGLTVDIYEELSINPAPQSHYKTTNAIPYVKASNWVADHGLDDAMMLDVDGNIAEATSSNLFLLIGEKLVTPDLEFGGLKGTMRATVIDLVSRSNINLDLAKIRPDDLEQAEEMFLTNASSGVRWVGAFKKKRYYNRLSKQLIGLLNQQANIS